LKSLSTKATFYYVSLDTMLSAYGLGYRVSIPDGHRASFFATTRGAPKERGTVGPQSPKSKFKKKRRFGIHDDNKRFTRFSAEISH